MTASSMSYDLEVRWGDLDALDHVNNTVFLRFIEEARVRYFNGLGVSLDSGRTGPVVVHIDCNFRRAITYPATVRVSLDAVRASDKRLLMTHRITDAGDSEVLYADARVTAVWVDGDTGRSVTLPESIRAAVPSADQ